MRHPFAPKASSFKRFGTMREAGLIAIILALGLIMSFASPHFLTLGNFRAMLMSFSIEGIVVVGMTVLLIVGGIDLAVGSVVCFAMVFAGSMFVLGLDPWTASALGILMSALIGIKLTTWPFPGPALLREGEQVHLIDGWRYLGTAGSDEEINQLLREGKPQFDRDTFKILSKHVAKMTPLPAHLRSDLPPSEEIQP